MVSIIDTNGQHMTFTSAGSDKPVADAEVTALYTAVEIRLDGSAGVNVEGFDNKPVNTNIAFTDCDFLTYRGALKR